MDSSRSKNFAQRLVTLMAEHDLGVRAAARLAGVGPSTIVSWRSGAQPRDFHAVSLLARQLGTTLGFLLTGEREPFRRAPPREAVTFRCGSTRFEAYAEVTVRALEGARLPGESFEPNAKSLSTSNFTSEPASARLQRQDAALRNKDES